MLGVFAFCARSRETCWLIACGRLELWRARFLRAFGSGEYSIRASKDSSCREWSPRALTEPRGWRSHVWFTYGVACAIEG